jgi:putative transposase
MYSYNSLLRWSSDTESWLERVLWVDEEDGQVVVFRIELEQGGKTKTSRAWPFWRPKAELDGALKTGSVRIMAKDPLLRPAVAAETLKEEARQHWEKVQKALHPITNDPARNIFRSRRERRGLVAEAAKSAGVHRTTVYALLVKFWRGGQTPQCLLGDYRACRGQTRRCRGGKKRGRPDALEATVGHKIGPALTEGIEKLLRRGRDKFYNKGAKTLKLAYDLTLGEFFNDDLELKDGVWTPVLKPASELPKFRTFLYVHRKHRDPEKEAKDREGLKSFELKGRALRRNTETELLGPGQLGQMDATTADVYLVSEDDPSVIVGRPVVYGIKDAWGRFLYSIVATFERPSYWSGALALENALVNKVEYCAGYGIKIKDDDWPVSFLPSKLLVDRGEMATYKSDKLIRELGLDVDVLPPGRGDLKGIIERHFGHINNQIVSWLPGALPRFEGDGHKRHELDAVLTIHEFRFLLLEATLKYHQHLMREYKCDEDMIAAPDVEKRPIALLRWARERRSGLFRQFDLEQARLQLLPGAAATVTKQGIRFKRVLFTCERAVSKKWFENARRFGTYPVQIAFDPRRVDPIYLRDSAASALEPCHLTTGDSRFRSWTWEALEEHLKNQTIEEIESAPEEAQDRVELHAKKKQIENNARSRQQAALALNPGQSAASRLNKIPRNRAAAKASERAKSLDGPAPPPPAVAQDQVSKKVIVLAGTQTPPSRPYPPVESGFAKKLRAQFNKAKGQL